MVQGPGREEFQTPPCRALRPLSRRRTLRSRSGHSADAARAQVTRPHARRPQGPGTKVQSETPGGKPQSREGQEGEGRRRKGTGEGRSLDPSERCQPRKTIDARDAKPVRRSPDRPSGCTAPRRCPRDELGPGHVLGMSWAPAMSSGCIAPRRCPRIANRALRNGRWQSRGPQRNGSANGSVGPTRVAKGWHKDAPILPLAFAMLTIGRRARQPAGREAVPGLPGTFGVAAPSPRNHRYPAMRLAVSPPSSPVTWEKRLHAPASRTPTMVICAADSG